MTHKCSVYVRLIVCSVKYVGVFDICVLGILWSMEIDVKNWDSKRSRLCDCKIVYAEIKAIVQHGGKNSMSFPRNALWFANCDTKTACGRER